MNWTIPKSVRDSTEELKALTEKYPIYLPLPVVAKFMGMNAEGLRCAIEQGRAPFGISWQKDAHGNKAFKIPTVTFFYWYTQINPFEQQGGM